jgi:hypothetical protein
LPTTSQFGGVPGGNVLLFALPVVTLAVLPASVRVGRSRLPVAQGEVRLSTGEAAASETITLTSHGNSALSRFAYLVALAVVAASVIAQMVELLGAWLGVSLRLGTLSSIAGWFASPVPTQLRFLVPGFLWATLLFVYAMLIGRRIWVFSRARSIVPPASFSKWPRVLLLVAATSLLLMVISLLLSAAIGAGTGVPASFLGIPASALLSPVLFYVEIRSLPWFSSRPMSA